MLFSSLFFLFGFLPVFLVVYYAIFLISLTSRARQFPWRSLSHLWILCSSIFFYAWGEFELVGIMLFSTLVDFYCARKIDRAQHAGRKGRPWLIASLCVNLGMLGFFKYFNFGIENLRAIMESVGATGMLAAGLPEIVLPLGISFYTFQSMSYTIDVYRRDVEATRSLLDFACYVTMFPQLVAGPIVRYRDVAAELRSRSLDLGSVASGAVRFSIGLSKKVLIANAVAGVADKVFSLPVSELTFGYAWIGSLAYTLQIYFDFSGYSDMAIGLGRMLGFNYPENFRYPYVARSNQDFWRRWHLSLSTWFRDYLYIPLGGNRRGPLIAYRNLVVVFLLCGLWHGASWSFIVWGAFHGLFLIFERRGLGRGLASMPRVVQHLYALGVAIGGWILFRAENLEQAAGFYAAMLGLGEGASSSTWLLGADFLAGAALGCVFSIPIVPWFLGRWRRWTDGEAGAAVPYLVVAENVFLAALPFILLESCAAALAAGTHNPFIYFRF